MFIAGVDDLKSNGICSGLLDGEVVDRVSTLVGWLKAMTSSPIRPLRLTAVVSLSMIVDCLLNKLADAHTTWAQTTSQYQTECNSAVRAVQMKSVSSTSFDPAFFVIVTFNGSFNHLNCHPITRGDLDRGTNTGY